jgi:hypothetical protein
MGGIAPLFNLGEIMEVAAQTTDYTKKPAKSDKKVNLKYQHDKDREPVRGIFRFYECAGAPLSFVYKAYKEDDVERFDLTDGCIYTIPLGVARHLNKSGRYPIHAFKQDEAGNVSSHIGKKVARYGFQSLEFVDISDVEATGSDGIIEVTEAP